MTARTQRLYHVDLFAGTYRTCACFFRTGRGTGLYYPGPASVRRLSAIASERGEVHAWSTRLGWGFTIPEPAPAACAPGCAIPEHEHYAEPGDGCIVDA